MTSAKTNFSRGFSRWKSEPTSWRRSLSRRTNESKSSRNGLRNSKHGFANTRIHIPRRVSNGRGLTSPRPRKMTKTTMSELTAVLPDEKTVTTRSGALQLIRTNKLRSPVTAVQSVANTSTSRWASAPDSSRRYRTRNHQKSHSTTATATSATPVEPRQLLHTPPRLPQ